MPNHKNPWFEPPDHGIGRSRGGLTTKLHLVCDGRGRPLGMMITGDQQQARYKGRNVVERCFNQLKQWRGIAMRSDKLLRSYRATVSLATTLIWSRSDLINTA